MLDSKKFIEERIELIINDWYFEKRKNANPKECPCYEKNHKCHEIKDLNCFFCYCPFYGEKCEIKSEQAKYIQTDYGKILDCSDCAIPHENKNIFDIIMRKFYGKN
jgi:Zn-finger protein